MGKYLKYNIKREFYKNPEEDSACHLSGDIKFINI